MRNILIKTLAIAAAAVWWAVFYPELSFIEGTYQLVLTDYEKTIIGQCDAMTDMDLTGSMFQEDVFSGLLKAGKDEIVIESRLLEWLSEK